MGKIVNKNILRSLADAPQNTEDKAEQQEIKEEVKEVQKEAEKADAAAPKAEKSAAAPAKKTAAKAAPKKVRKPAPIVISGDLLGALQNTAANFAQSGRKKAAEEIAKIYERGTRNFFTVAVVGEFSRGKSTFVNELLGKEVLPSSDLPTTAMLTRIRNSDTEVMVHYDVNNRKVAKLPVEPESWEGLVADNFGKHDPTGTILMGVRNAWLENNNIELIDTPGAGDLEAKRALVIGDALLGSDGAIVAIDATKAMSMSEMLFMEQRLITGRTPFLMIVINKLDLINKKERSSIIRHVMNKLEGNGWNIPVYVKNDVEMDAPGFEDIIGIENIKKKIVSWITSPERTGNTERWIAAQALSVIDRELTALGEQKTLLETDETKRKELIEEKLTALKKTGDLWEEIRKTMKDYSHACRELVRQKADEYKVTITERLQYEAGHAAQPEKWWNEDYPYRVKVELANMATGIDSAINKRISEDINAFNIELEKNFRTHVITGRRESVISGKDVITANGTEHTVELADIDKMRNITKIGTGALTIAGTLLSLSCGMIPIVATIGVSTGSSIVTERVFKGKLEKQRNELKETIALTIPGVVDMSCAESGTRIDRIYENIIKDAVEKEQSWAQAQKEAIESSVKPMNKEAFEKLAATVKTLEDAAEVLKEYC